MLVLIGRGKYPLGDMRGLELGFGLGVQRNLSECAFDLSGQPFTAFARRLFFFIELDRQNREKARRNAASASLRKVVLLV